MKRLVVASLLAVAAGCFSADSASAQQPYGNLGFFPYGFYQPYGAHYGTSVRTPPYFSLNPPVYYGARHARPYGLSPFASPPLVSAGENYTSRLRLQFEQPLVPTPQPHYNPCVSGSSVIKADQKVSGPVRVNPFVDPSDQLAKN